MSRLVEAKLAAARQLDRGQQAESLLAGGVRKLDALGLQRRDGCLYVVAHEEELVASAIVRRMSRQLDIAPVLLGDDVRLYGGPGVDRSSWNGLPSQSRVS